MKYELFYIDQQYDLSASSNNSSFLYKKTKIII